LKNCAGLAWGTTRKTGERNLQAEICRLSFLLATLAKIVAHHGGERQQHHRCAENLKSDHFKIPVLENSPG
jgi:hypothetical protein